MSSDDDDDKTTTIIRGKVGKGSRSLVGSVVLMMIGLLLLLLLQSMETPDDVQYVYDCIDCTHDRFDLPANSSVFHNEGIAYENTLLS